MEIPKFFKTKSNIKLVVGALIAATTVSTFVPSLDADKTTFHSSEFEQSISRDITLEEMKNLIYSSTRLTDEEKAFLYNEDFFADILPYINQSERMKFIYRSKFDDLDIKNINSIMFNTLTPYQGFYLWNPSHNLYVHEYDGVDNGKDHTLSHEFLHSTQDTNTYAFFMEPVAEMMSSEYYGGEIDCYKSTIKSLKVLMEIIGTEPIKQYVFTGDFSMIEERVKPNLSEEEYSEFLDCVSQELVGSRNSERNSRLMKIYQSLYLNIYGEPMRNNEVISLVLSDSDKLVRPYFNDRLGNSYCLLVSKAGGTNDGPGYHYLEPISEKEELFKSEYTLN